MKEIILTKDKADGLLLRKRIRQLRPNFIGLDCFVKDDVLKLGEQFMDTEYIFSSWYMPIFDEEEIKKAFPSLKAVFYAAGTVKYFAEPFLSLGIRVFSAAKANGISVAEYTVAQILLANKGFFQAQRSCKSFLWRFAFRKAKKYTDNRQGNYAAKVGLIGCGAVGSQVVRFLKSYDIEIMVYDPFLSAERCAELGVEQVDLVTLFESCDVISNHLPDIQNTKNIINYALLSKMKDYSTFINTGRGAQVVESDLAKVLRKRPSICAVLDVTQHEPPFPWSPLLRRGNVFLSPHIAGSTGNEVLRMVEYALQAYDDIIEGRLNNNEVTLGLLDKMA